MNLTAAPSTLPWMNCAYIANESVRPYTPNSASESRRPSTVATARKAMIEAAVAPWIASVPSARRRPSSEGAIVTPAEVGQGCTPAVEPAARPGEAIEKCLTSARSFRLAPPRARVGRDAIDERRGFGGIALNHFQALESIEQRLS